MGASFGSENVLVFITVLTALLASGCQKKEREQEVLPSPPTEVASTNTVDATQWGEDTSNPFSNLAAEGQAALEARGVDVKKLQQMKAVRITGQYDGANFKSFVCRDPNVIVIFEEGFLTRGKVESEGPILARGDARFLGEVMGKGLVWFVEDSAPQGKIMGNPIIFATTVQNRYIKTNEGARMFHGDYGYRRPGTEKDSFAEVKGVDVMEWAKATDNPFANITAESEAELQKQGVDMGAIKKMKAVLLTGEYYGASAQTFISRDPNTILVVGKDFGSHGDIYSAGPLLARENAHFMGGVVGKGLVWFVEESMPRRRVGGNPIIFAPGIRDRSLKIDAGSKVLHGDYGYRWPGMENDPFPFIKGADVTEWAKPTENPFTNITTEGETELVKRGLDIPGMKKMKALLLTGKYYGVNSKTFVNRDPNTILVVGKGYSSFGEIYSAGPVLACSDAQFLGAITANGLLWFVEQSEPRGKTSGNPVIIAPTIREFQMKLQEPVKLWRGDFGWRPPTGSN